MTYEFDGFVVDPEAFRISKSGRQLRIEPKALQILIYLLERPGRLVTKQELFEAVWPGLAVTENALTRAIAQLRKTLGDGATAPRYIETVPTRGYRFIGALQTEGTSAAAAVPPKPKRWKLLFIIPIAIVVVLVGERVVKMAAKRGANFRAIIAQPSPLAGRLLHPSPRFQVSPSFSPDAASVVYSVDVDGVPHLFIAPTRGGDERQLTTGADGEAQPSWSPDGKQIAFTSLRRHGIWLVDAERGDMKRLTTFGSRPSWSADGAEIAFQSGEDVEYGWNAFDALPPSTIWIVDVASGKTASLTKKGAPAGGHGAPSWRHDGKRLAFSSCDHERCGLYTIARDSSGLTELLMDPRRLSSPLFAHDGRTVDAVLSRYNESTLFEISVDANGERISDARPLRQSNPGVIQYVAMSRDGFRFAWSLVEEKSDLYSVEGGRVSKLTNNPASNPTFPSFSPDGKQIAYCTVASGDDSGIWIANADGTNARALITGAGLKQYVRWGRSEWDVFYAAWNEDRHRPLLYRASLINGQSQVVAELPEDAAAPEMSPQMDRVAFNRTLGGWTSVWTSKLDGSSLRRMSADGDLARFPAWSPDGKRLAVQLRRDGSSIAILPEGKVIANGGENWPHSWSPDGKQIAFAGRRDGFWNVWTAEVATGKQSRVTDFN